MLDVVLLINMVLYARGVGFIGSVNHYLGDNRVQFDYFQV
jgi:hypothetical protein